MSLHSTEAEQSVIGACLLDNSVIDRISDVLTYQDFHTLEHAVIWSAMARLRADGQDVDVVTVSERMEHERTGDDVGGLAYLAELARNTPSAANAMTYAEIVADLAGRRRLLDEMANLEALTQDKRQALTGIVDSAQDRLLRLLRHEGQQGAAIGIDLGDMLDEIDRRWNGDENPMGVSFGLTDLDERTLGMHPGQLILVGGRPAAGKTAFALNVLRACCVRDRRPAVVFSMEMDRRALRNRMTAAVCDVPLRAIRDPKAHMTPEYFDRMAGIHLLKDAPLIIDDRAGMTPAQIRRAAKRWRDHYGKLGVVMVDYLQLARPDRKHGSREQEVSELSRSMKLLAKELHCPVLALSQLNRGLEARQDKRPHMADLRESGSLEQDADLILFLYRHEAYEPDDELTQGVAEIIIGKQREGETGTIYVAARLANARFEDLDRVRIAQLMDAAKTKNTPMRKPKSAMEVI